MTHVREQLSTHWRQFTDRLPERPTRPVLTPAQRLYAKFFIVGFLTALGVGAALAGAVLLLMSALAGTVLGVVLSALAVSLGGTTAVGGYLWFTL